MTHAARGFSLLEVLLATTILAAGLALALTTLRAAGASVERAEAIAAREDQMRAVEGFLRRRLGSALALSFGEDPASGRAQRFVGEPDRLAFVSEMPAYLGRSGPGLTTVALHHEADAPSWLGLSFATVVAGQVVADTPPRAPERLVEDVREFRVRFRSRDLPGQPGGWSEHWTQSEHLPMQVEINIMSAAGPWPPLVINLPQGGAR